MQTAFLLGPPLIVIAGIALAQFSLPLPKRTNQQGIALWRYCAIYGGTSLMAVAFATLYLFAIRTILH